MAWTEPVANNLAGYSAIWKEQAQRAGGNDVGEPLGTDTEL